MQETKTNVVTGQRNMWNNKLNFNWNRPQTHHWTWKLSDLGKTLYVNWSSVQLFNIYQIKVKMPKRSLKHKTNSYILTSTCCGVTCVFTCRCSSPLCRWGTLLWEKMVIQVATSVPFLFTPASYRVWEKRENDRSFITKSEETFCKRADDLTHSGVFVNLLVVDDVGGFVSLCLHSKQ